MLLNTPFLAGGSTTWAQLFVCTFIFIVVVIIINCRYGYMRDWCMGCPHHSSFLLCLSPLSSHGFLRLVKLQPCGDAAPAHIWVEPFSISTAPTVSIKAQQPVNKLAQCQSAVWRSGLYSSSAAHRAPPGGHNPCWSEKSHPDVLVWPVQWHRWLACLVAGGGSDPDRRAAYAHCLLAWEEDNILYLLH